MRRIIYLLLCLFSVLLVKAQTNFTYKFWFDRNDEDIVAVNGNEALEVNLDVSALNPGIHSLYMQVKDSGQVVAPVVMRNFLKIKQIESSSLRYWFDKRFTQAKTMNQTGIIELDASNLSEGFHTLYMQSLGSKGWASPVKSQHFLCLNQDTAAVIRYWFDQNDEATTPMNHTGTLFLDASKLPFGFHTLYMQTVNMENVAGPAKSQHFLCVKEDSAKSLRYWFDRQDLKSVTLAESGIYNLETDGLADGFHTLYIQTQENQVSPACQRIFYKVPQDSTLKSLSCDFFVDGKFYKKEIPGLDNLVNYNIDALPFSTGFHTVDLHVVNKDGACLDARRSYFLRVPTMLDMDSLTCFYRIDGEREYSKSLPLAQDAFTFNIDVNGLSEGLHRIVYMLVGKNKMSSELKSMFFYKRSKHASLISAYAYWFNDQMDNSMYIPLDRPVEELVLDENWATRAFPIRSSNYHFEWKGNSPYIYAKNEIHARFFDVEGHVSEAASTYIDRSVSKVLDQVEFIHPNETKDFSLLDRDSIQWYRLNVLKEDSIYLTTNQACKMELFAPSGEEQLALADSVRTDVVRCVAQESGCYYLALHDVEANANKAVQITYHLSDFNRLRYDVNEDIFVNEEDYQLIVDYYLGKPVDVPVERLDVNRDGIVDVQDAVLVQKNFTKVHEGILNVEP